MLRGQRQNELVTLDLRLSVPPIDFGVVREQPKKAPVPDYDILDTALGTVDDFFEFTEILAVAIDNWLANKFVQFCSFDRRGNDRSSGRARGGRFDRFFWRVLGDNLVLRGNGLSYRRFCRLRCFYRLG